MSTTTTLLGFAFDDGGRADSGRSGQVGDCVTRALSIVTHRLRLPLAGATPGETYDNCYRTLAAREGAYTGSKRARGRAARTRPGVRTAARGISKPVSRKLFAEVGLATTPQFSPRLTFTEVAELTPVAIVTTTKHVIAIVDGAMRDLGDWRTYQCPGRIECRVDNHECTTGFTVDAHQRKAAAIWVPQTAL